MIGKILKETVKTIVSPTRLAKIGISYSAIKQYQKDLKRKGEKMSLSSAYDYFGKPAVDGLKKLGSKFEAGIKNMQKKNMGGMATARKKNMGLQYKMGGGHMKKKSPMATYKKGGSVKSSSKKSRGTGAAIKGTKFKGVF